MTNPWIEAMRLRTLPVSVAGVFTGAGLCTMAPDYRIVPVALCLVFAILAQIASNFANEYYDYKAGLDRPGREGPRRGVTEGDITPEAMRNATFLTLMLACAVGLGLIYYGGWWLIFAGAFIAVGALSYSAGPYPLSHHALGEVAVLFFFGVIPVNLTFYTSTLCFSPEVMLASVSVGLMGANVLIVNNYRDAGDDSAVGKTTIAVKFGRRFASRLYLVNGYVSVALMSVLWLEMPLWSWIFPVAYLLLHTSLWRSLHHLHGAALTPVLGKTAVTMLAYSLAFAIAAFIC